MNIEEKEIEEMWEKGFIQIPIYHNDIDVDKESMREEFEYKLKLLLEGV